MTLTTPRWLALLSLLALCPAPALASMGGGLYIDLPRITVNVNSHSTFDWEPEMFKDLALWDARLDALATQQGWTHFDLEVDFDELLIARDNASDVVLNTSRRPELDGATLFQYVVDALSVNARDADAARQTIEAVDVYTLQCYSARKETNAKKREGKLNWTLNQTGNDLYGFVSAIPNGHEAYFAHTVAAQLEGQPIYRVHIGAYLKRAQAEKARDAIYAASGESCFVTRF